MTTTTTITTLDLSMLKPPPVCNYLVPQQKTPGNVHNELSLIRSKLIAYGCTHLSQHHCVVQVLLPEIVVESMTDMP